MGFFSSRKVDDDALDEGAVSRVIRSRFVRPHTQMFSCSCALNPPVIVQYGRNKTKSREASTVSNSPAPSPLSGPSRLPPTSLPATHSPDTARTTGRANGTAPASHLRPQNILKPSSSQRPSADAATSVILLLDGNFWLNMFMHQRKPRSTAQRAGDRECRRLGQVSNILPSTTGSDQTEVQDIAAMKNTDCSVRAFLSASRAGPPFLPRLRSFASAL